MSEEKKQGNLKFADTGYQEIFKHPSPLVNYTIEKMFNKAYEKDGLTVHFPEGGNAMLPRKNAKYQSGISDEVDVTGEGMLFFTAGCKRSPEGSRYNLEIESAGACFGGKYLEYAIQLEECLDANGERGEFPLQCVIVLHPQRQNDPDVRRVQRWNKLGVQVVDYSIPILYIDDTAQGTVFEPYALTYKAIMSNNPEEQRSYIVRVRNSIISVAHSCSSDKSVMMALNLRNAISVRLQASNRVDATALAEFIGTEESFMEYVKNYDITETLMERRGREKATAAAEQRIREAQEAEESAKRRLSDAAKRMVCNGLTQEEITSYFGSDIWTTEMLTYYAVHSPHIRPEDSTRPGISHMNLDKQ